MHRIHIDAWLTDLDDALADGIAHDPALVERAREALRSNVVPESDADARWLRLEVGDIERRYGISLT